MLLPNHVSCQVQEQCEKECVLLKELERLRLHLVAVEEGYTQEALNAEEQVKELQNKLAQAEERIKNSSTAYTSARCSSCNFGFICIRKRVFDTHAQFCLY